MPTGGRVDSVLGLILAGGLGRRMGGVDKGLVELDGQPLVAHVLRRFAPQVDRVVINANQNGERYAALGHAVVPDTIGGFAGPLAGLHAGLVEAGNSAPPARFLATVPCDSPFVPTDLVVRLHDALGAAGASIAVARTGEQAHPVFMLTRVDVLADLAAYLESGGRKMDAWYRRLPHVEVAFDDEPEAFANINTRDELAALATRDKNT